MAGSVLRKALPVGALLAAAIVWPGAARAIDEALEYQADAGCPDRDAFLGAALRKMPGKKPTAIGLLKVEVRATPAGYTGTLERGPDRGSEPPVPRVLSAARCEDVVEALALTVALSLVPPPDPAPEVAVTAVAPPPRPPRPPTRRHLSLAAGLQAGRFVTGSPMLGAALAVGLTGAASDGARWSVGLEGRLRLSWNRSDVGLAPGRARFELMVAGVELCPVHVRAGRARLGLCGLAEVGRLGGEGIGIPHPRWDGSTWLAFGGGPELAVALTRRWHLIGSAFVSRPLRQTRFIFAEPTEPVARTAGAALSGSLALAVHFP
jgi:hypothetical protein